MAICKTREVHKKHQQDVKTFAQNKGETMIDFMITDKIEKGDNDINSISSKLRMAKNQLLGAINPKLFKVSNGKIFTI